MRVQVIQDIIDVVRHKPLAQNNPRFQNSWFKKCYKEFIAKDTAKRFDALPQDFFPCLRDNTESSEFDAHSVYHTTWAFREVLARKPNKHIDISSSMFFCSYLSALIPVDFYDYRPAKITLSQLTCMQADACQLPFDSNSIDSLSCMHVVEHIGLGRYGDTIDPEGDIKAINELKRVIKVNGYLYFVVPISDVPKICFNAHRIYSYEMIKSYFTDFTLEVFALVQDDRTFIPHATKSDIEKQKYACGCFVFKK